MSTFFDKYKYGIIAVLACYFMLFVYLQLETYNHVYVIQAFADKAAIEEEAIDLNPEQIEMEAFDIYKTGDVKSFAQDENEEREKSKTDYSPNKQQFNAEQRIKELEKEYYAQSGESEKRDKIKQELAAIKEKQANSKNNKQDNNSSTNGGNKAYDGTTMVEWSLKNRTPHQGNEWYVRNPGYTCGYGTSGVVVMKIKVNQNGNVSSATYDPSTSSNASNCMIEQAKKYALMSRFSYASNSSQEGWIKYIFIAQ